MKKQKIIISIIGLVAVVGLLAVIIFNRQSVQEVSTEDPVDMVVDFYKKWAEERNSTSTNPYDSGLSKSGILSKELRAKIKEAKNSPEGEPDPVLCQTVLDNRISTRKVYENESEMQILITLKDKLLTGQAVYTLKKLNEGWYIDDITCSPGEFGEEREFTFERTGSLIKGSLLESVNPEDWYLVFEEDAQLGHSAKLIFNNDSMCTNKGADEKVCSTDQFSQSEPTQVSVKGQMTEYGVEVKKVDFSI